MDGVAQIDSKGKNNNITLFFQNHFCVPRNDICDVAIDNDCKSRPLSLIFLSQHLGTTCQQYANINWVRSTIEQEYLPPKWNMQMLNEEFKMDPNVIKWASTNRGRTQRFWDSWIQIRPYSQRHEGTALCKPSTSHFREIKNLHTHSLLLTDCYVITIQLFNQPTTFPDDDKDDNVRERWTF